MDVNQITRAIVNGAKCFHIYGEFSATPIRVVENGGVLIVIFKKDGRERACDIRYFKNNFVIKDSAK